MVKHVHVCEGGPAVVADTINQHEGGAHASESVEQSHATNAVAGSAALPRPYPLGNGVSLTGDVEWSLSPARRADPGPPKGHQNAFRHGLRSAAFLQRKALAHQLMAAVRAL